METLTNLTDKFFVNLTADSQIVKKTKNWDKDKICFQKALGDFLKSGSKQDAFVVYYCYSEIFKLFGCGYDNTQKLLETLSDHEYHSGELLTKHRDHYSHSVYVFALGLAVFASDPAFRKAFTDFYGCDGGNMAAFRFLELWGLVALFHDIGYPFQLAHEQIKAYNAELWGDDGNVPYVSYGDIKKFIAIDEDDQKLLNDALNPDFDFSDINRLLAYGLNIREGYDVAAVCEILLSRVTEQRRFMDHGYFSAVILARQLFTVDNFKMDMPGLDVLTAILLHNNFNKYDAPDRHPIAIDEHPLAYLLILCDELQSWDRLAYGKVSKRDPIAWNAEFEIGENLIKAVFVFESAYVNGENDKFRLNKTLSEIQDDVFTAKILGGEDARSKKHEKYIQSDLNLQASAEVRKKDKKANLYASDDNFINLCDFAKAIHASYNDLCKIDKNSIEGKFSELPLEYKVSNIDQAKSYAEKLELINCFYSSKDLDYPVVEDFKKDEYGNFGSDNFEFLCREEHVRWTREKIALGWRYGEQGRDFTDKDDRNNKHMHNCLVPYELLSDDDKAKDALMINNIIPMLKKFGNNIRIYSYRSGRKPDLVIGGVGHRYFTEDCAKLKDSVKKILTEYSKTHRVIVRTGYAFGADQLIAECADELGISTKAALPYAYDDFIEYAREDAKKSNMPYTDEDEMRLRLLLAQTVVCKNFADKPNPHVAVANYIVNKCDKLIALWDGVELPLFNGDGEPVNRGGTSHVISLAKEKGMRVGEDIHIIRCHR